MNSWLNRFLFSLIFILLLISESVQCQIYPFNNYSVRQGLINSNVYAMVQDQAGFIWLGTENGLSRFDGINFKNYPLDQLGIKAYISSLLVLDSGEIMFGSGSDGIFIFNPITEKVRLFSQALIIRSNQLLITENILISLHEIQTYSFLSMETGQRIMEDHIFNDNTDIKAISMIKLKNKSVLLGRSDGVYILKGHVIEKMNIKGMPSLPAFSFYEDKDEILIGGLGIIYKVNNFEVVDSIIVDKSRQKKIRNLQKDNLNNIWFNYWGLKDWFLLKNENLINISEKVGINSGTVTGIIKDYTGTILVSSIGKGIFVFNNDHLFVYPESHSFSNVYIHKIIKVSSNGIMLGTNNGLAYLNIKDETLYDINHPIDNNQYIRDIIITSKNECIVATIDPRFSKSLSEPYRWETDNLDIRYIHSSTLCMDSKHIYVGNWDNRILIFDLISHKLSGTIENLFKNIVRVNCTYIDNLGNLWAGGQKGLCIIDKNKNKFYIGENFQEEEIHQISYHKNNQVIVVTNSGFYILKTSNNPDQIQIIEERKLLGTNCVVSTGENEFLTGTSYGLYFLKGGKKTLITIQDGILSENINDIYFDSESSTSWVGTAEGLMQVDMELLRKTNTNPLEIKQIIMIRNGEKSIPGTSDVFEYNENEFILKFQAFYYNNPGKIRYQYKTDSNQWLNAPSNEVQFASMAHGEHNISVRAGLSDNAWGPVKTINFTVLPPFYQTWWFYLSEALAGATLIAFLIRLRLQQIKKKQEEEIQIKQKIVELQQKALASNLNPHFVFNSLNAIQHFINCKSASEANIYLAKFSRLMRMHLNMAENSTIILQYEIQRLEFYLSLEQLRFDKKLKWEIIIDPLLKPEILEIPNMVIQPFIENSIWHGIMPASYAGYISLQITTGPEDSIIIIVTDNGVGIHYKHKAGITGENSRGTRLIHERLRLLDPENKNDLTYEELNPGTRVTIVLSSKMYRRIAEEEPVFG